jgi:hypothetical protein
MVPNNAGDNPANMHANFDFNLGVAAAVHLGCHLLLHVERQIDKPHGLLGAQDVRGYTHLAGLDAGCRHIRVAYSLNLLDAMLETQTVVEPEKVIEHEHDIASFFFHDAIEIANVAEKDGHIILGLRYSELPKCHLCLNELWDQDREDVVSAMRINLDLLLGQVVMTTLPLREVHGASCDYTHEEHHDNTADATKETNYIVIWETVAENETYPEIAADHSNQEGDRVKREVKCRPDEIHLRECYKQV